jgi:hypothetical protein
MPEDGPILSPPSVILLILKEDDEDGIKDQIVFLLKMGIESFPIL